MGKTSEIFRKNVGRLLEARNWTQAQLAQKVGVRPPTISRILSGTNNPELDTVEAIAKAFEITVPELLTDSTPPDSEKAIREATELLHDLLKIVAEKAGLSWPLEPEVLAKLMRDSSHKSKR